MNALREMLRDFFGLFVEDGSLALAIIGVVAAAILATLAAPPGGAGRERAAGAAQHPAAAAFPIGRPGSSAKVQ